MNLKQDADTAANYFRNSVRPALERDQLRDFLDAWTQGGLDCLQLDILCDMVEARLGRANKPNLKGGRQAKPFYGLGKWY